MKAEKRCDGRALGARQAHSRHAHLAAGTGVGPRQNHHLASIAERGAQFAPRLVQPPLLPSMEKLEPTFLEGEEGSAEADPFKYIYIYIYEKAITVFAKLIPAWMLQV